MRKGVWLALAAWLAAGPASAQTTLVSNTNETRNTMATDRDTNEHGWGQVITSQSTREIGRIDVYFRAATDVRVDLKLCKSINVPTRETAHSNFDSSASNCIAFGSAQTVTGTGRVSFSGREEVNAGAHAVIIGVDKSASIATTSSGGETGEPGWTLWNFFWFQGGSGGSGEWHRQGQGVDDHAIVLGVIEWSAADRTATGKPTIAGDFRVGGRLTASASEIVDPDGITTRPQFQYQWLRYEADGSFSDILGDVIVSDQAGTNPNVVAYTLTAADDDKWIAVSVTYTDDANHQTNIDSELYPRGGTVGGGSIRTPGDETETPGQDGQQGVDQQDDDRQPPGTTGTGTVGGGGRGRTAPRNEAPTVSAACEPCSVRPGAEVELQAAAADADGDELTYAWTAPGGRFEGGAGEAATRWTAPDAPGAVTIVVTVSDGRDGSASAAITIEVTNDAPMFEAASLAFELRENADGSAAPVDIGAATASDTDSDELTYELASGDASRFEVGARDGALRYIGPGEDFEAEPNRYELAVRVRDPYGGLAEVRVAVTVVNVNELPEAEDDQAAADEDQAVWVDVLRNDSDPDGDGLRVESVSEPAHGTAALTRGGVRYTPPPNYHGADRFTYVVADGNGGTAEAAVEVTVTAEDEGGLTATQTFAVGVSDRLVRGVVSETLAGLARSHLASARMTLGRRVTANPAEPPRLTVLGRAVPLGKAAAGAAAKQMLELKYEGRVGTGALVDAHVQRRVGAKPGGAVHRGEFGGRHGLRRDPDFRVVVQEFGVQQQLRYRPDVGFAGQQCPDLVGGGGRSRGKTDLVLRRSGLVAGREENEMHGLRADRCDGRCGEHHGRDDRRGCGQGAMADDPAPRRPLTFSAVPGRRRQRTRRVPAIAYPFLRPCMNHDASRTRHTSGAAPPPPPYLAACSTGISSAGRSSSGLAARPSRPATRQPRC